MTCHQGPHGVVSTGRPHTLAQGGGDTSTENWRSAAVRELWDPWSLQAEGIASVLGRHPGLRPLAVLQGLDLGPMTHLALASQFPRNSFLLVLSHPLF